MKTKDRIVFRIVITAMIVFVVSAVVTFFNIGLRSDCVVRWLTASVICWPVAAGTGCVVIPLARTVTQRIVSAIEGTA